MEQKMTSHQTTAAQFAADRLANFQAGNVAALIDQYHADASVITPNGVLRGRDQIGGMIEGIIAEFSQPGVDFKLLSRAADLPRSFDDLFSADAVDELVSGRGLRTPFLRMAKEGTTLEDRSFTRGGGIGAAIADQASDDAVLQHFADGATLVLQGLHRTWRPVVDFSQSLAAELGHPVQVNAYVTPPGNTGFSDHYDVHDVFVLQVAGEKRWRIRPPVHELPLRDEPWTAHRAAVEEAARAAPLIEETFAPGDCLYLPRGYLHSATALGGTSIHLTIGVHAWTRRHVADELVRAAVARASRATQLREALPLGTDLVGEGAASDDVEVVRANGFERCIDRRGIHCCCVCGTETTGLDQEPGLERRNPKSCLMACSGCDFTAHVDRHHQKASGAWPVGSRNEGPHSGRG